MTLIISTIFERLKLTIKFAIYMNNLSELDFTKKCYRVKAILKKIGKM